MFLVRHLTNLRIFSIFLVNPCTRCVLLHHSIALISLRLGDWPTMLSFFIEIPLIFNCVFQFTPSVPVPTASSVPNTMLLV